MNEIIDEALAILELEFPFDENALKSAFRNKAHISHPDHGGSEEEFKQVMSSYELLVDFSQTFVEDKGLSTVGGILLSELGKGLPNKNAAKCDNCKGLGYTTTTNRRLISGESCPACFGLGVIFIFKGFNREWMTCQRCQGKGIFSPVYQEKGLHHVCLSCDGTGEVEIFNPVLKKGVVSTTQKVKRDKKKNYCPQCGARINEEKCWRCNSTLMRIQ